LLYIYASYLKQLFLIGNLVISMLVGLSILIIPIFDILPSITPLNRNIQLIYFKLILNYALIASFLNLIREISKDIESIDDDYKLGMKTLPIVIGKQRASIVLFSLSIIPILIITYYIINTIYKQQIHVVYFLVFILGPLIYIAIKTFSAKTKKQFHHISNAIRLVFFFGALSLLLYRYA